MLAEAVEEWAAEAYAEGFWQGWLEGFQQGRLESRLESIQLLRHIAVWRFGVAVDDGFGQLLAGEDDFDRLIQVTDLVLECANAEELLARTRRLLKDGNGVR